MLKGREMIDLKQESPYGDIRIFATSRLDEELRISQRAKKRREKIMCREQ